MFGTSYTNVYAFTTTETNVPGFFHIPHLQYLVHIYVKLLISRGTLGHNISAFKL